MENALKIVKRLNKLGFRCLYVGGAVRDMLLGKAATDIDLATDALPHQIQEIFPHSHAIGEKFGIIMVVENDQCFEVATFREEDDYSDGRHPEKISYTADPQLDAQRRDFTVNGMFYDPLQDKVIDFVGGQEDLRCGIIRCIGEAGQRFNEDYLRMLRAVRFATRFNFTLDLDIRKAIRSNAGKCATLSGERIREELQKMLLSDFAADAFRTMLELGLLKTVLAEVAGLAGVAQHEKYHPEGDVFVHTMLMLEHLRMQDPALAWSVLLHDIGKKHTLTIGNDGVEHFYNHEKVGAEMIAAIADRLKFPGSLKKKIESAIINHMRFAHVKEMRPGKLKKMICDENFPLELELHRIDCIASHGKLDNYVFLLDKLNEDAKANILPEPLINGNDLIKSGLKPSPAFKKILDWVMELQLDGQIHSYTEAMESVQKFLDSHNI